MLVKPPIMDSLKAKKYEKHRNNAKVSCASSQFSFLAIGQILRFLLRIFDHCVKLDTIYSVHFLMGISHRSSTGIFRTNPTLLSSYLISNKSKTTYPIWTHF